MLGLDIKECAGQKICCSISYSRKFSGSVAPQGIQILGPIPLRASLIRVILSPALDAGSCLGGLFSSARRNRPFSKLVCIHRTLMPRLVFSSFPCYFGKS